jgi:hypothetical protein
MTDEQAILERINVPDTFCFLFFVGEDKGEPGCDTFTSQSVIHKGSNVKTAHPFSV